MVNDFRDLKVWQKAHQMVLDIYKVTKGFPPEEKYGVVSQIRRSAVSVCANIAEGGKKSTKDYLRFLEISHGSLEETRYYFILGKDLGYLSEEKFQSLWRLSDEVGKMLHGISRSIRC